MATYIATLNFTQQGIEAIGQTTKRAADFSATLEKMGAKVVNVYWTMGAYDGLIIFEAPDDETAAAAMLKQASKGNVHASTVRAFSAAEIEKVLGKLG